MEDLRGLAINISYKDDTIITGKCLYGKEAKDFLEKPYFPFVLPVNANCKMEISVSHNSSFPEIGDVIIAHGCKHIVISSDEYGFTTNPV